MEGPTNSLAPWERWEFVSNRGSRGENAVSALALKPAISENPRDKIEGKAERKMPRDWINLSLNPWLFKLKVLRMVESNMKGQPFVVKHMLGKQKVLDSITGLSY